MTEDLRGKRILITGASTGIGAAAAIAFGRLGAIVGVHYNTSAAAAQHVVRAIADDGGIAELFQANLMEPETAAPLVRAAAADLGGLDILINNAGALVQRSLFLDWNDDFYERVMNLNVKSLINATQAAVPFLITHGGGAIVNLGSISGNNGGGPGAGMYSAAKAFVHNVTRHMATDLAKHNIRVNAVAPGVVGTPFHSETPADRMEAMRASVPMGRIGTPEDCVGPLLFLASSAMSGYVTGQILHVNGGQMMPA